MCVVSHEYGGFGGGRDLVVYGMHAGTKPRVLVACQEMPEHF